MKDKKPRSRYEKDVKHWVLEMYKTGIKIKKLSQWWSIPERTIKFWVYGKQLSTVIFDFGQSIGNN